MPADTCERNRGATRATNPFGIILCILPNGFVFHVLPPAKFRNAGGTCPVSQTPLDASKKS